MILSVDLASRRWRDNGIALLAPQGNGATVRLVAPVGLGLRGTPEAEPFAEALHGLAEREGVRVILLDGPQGWRAEQSALVHLRHCEKETRCPGKTGLPGIVKPATWRRMAEFSIAIFDALDARGWPRFTRAWQNHPRSARPLLLLLLLSLLSLLPFPPASVWSVMSVGPPTPPPVR
jgi:hypothetical protein